MKADIGMEKHAGHWSVGPREGLKGASGEVNNYKLGTKKMSSIKQLPRTWETGRRPRKTEA